jgi:molecular chaperone Hsp33
MKAAPGGRGGDRIVRGVLREQSVRVVAVVTTGVAREAAERHGAVGAAAVALGRAATAGLLLATLTKDEERVTVQVLGNGPLGAIMVDANAGGGVRVCAKHPTATAPALPGTRVPLARAVGSDGVVRVARDLGLRDVVSGQTPIADGEIDTDLEHYLDASEQIASALACDTLLDADLDVAASGGILLQTLPGSGALPVLDALRERLRAGALCRRLAASPAPTAEALARDVLGEEAADLVVLDSRPVRFHCSCSRERAGATLALLGADELGAMAREDQGATVTCEFCRNEYRFARQELDDLRLQASASPAGAGQS